MFRVVLIHHPPIPNRGHYMKRLIDGPKLRALLAKHGAELLLHGHNHEHQLMWLDGPHGRIPAVGVPSASAIVSDHDEPAAYNLYRIAGEPGAWHCEAVTRGLDKGAEFDADHHGVVLAVRAGYEPYGLASALRKIAARNPKEASLSLLFKTHPLPQERLEKLGDALGDSFDRFSGAKALPERFSKKE